MTAPDGKIRIPLERRAEDGKVADRGISCSDYNGEGIQHIALRHRRHLRRRRHACANGGMSNCRTRPTTYYDMLDKRLPGHGEAVDELRKRAAS